MKFLKQSIKGVYLIKPNIYKDQRGLFRRHFCETEFYKHKLEKKVKQANVSINYKKGTLRGFHYQKKPFQEDKTMSCLKGEIYDIILDLRKKSKTYGKWLSFRLSEKNKYSVHIPKGCANAFLTLKNNTIVHYYCSELYNPRYEGLINYRDPIFKFKWPIKIKSISKKDKFSPFLKK